MALTLNGRAGRAADLRAPVHKIAEVQDIGILRIGRAFGGRPVRIVFKTAGLRPAHRNGTVLTETARSNFALVTNVVRLPLLPLECAR